MNNKMCSVEEKRQSIGNISCETIETLKQCLEMSEVLLNVISGKEVSKKEFPPTSCIEDFVKFNNSVAYSLRDNLTVLIDLIK